MGRENKRTKRGKPSFLIFDQKGSLGVRLRLLDIAGNEVQDIFISSPYVYVWSLLPQLPFLPHFPLLSSLTSPPGMKVSDK